MLVLQHKEFHGEVRADAQTKQRFFSTNPLFFTPTPSFHTNTLSNCPDNNSAVLCRQRNVWTTVINAVFI